MDLRLQELGKKSGQIPAFGDWDNANQLPITQYFESARQAGLLRFPPNTNTHHHPHQHQHQYCDNSYISTSSARTSGGAGYGFAYTSADFQKPPIRVVHVPRHRKVGTFQNQAKKRLFQFHTASQEFG